MSRENEKNDGSEIDLTIESVEPKANSQKPKKLDAIKDFPAWLDLQLERIVEEYDEFSTSSSRRGYFGRKSK